MPMIEFHNVQKWYGEFHVLKGISDAVETGEVLVICGPSGSGKSTLIRCVNRLEEYQKGHILFDGHDIHGDDIDVNRLRCDIGIVFQQFNLVPSLTVAGNIAFQARIAGRFDAAWQEELMERLGLAALGHRYPEQLSGGQQQRVAIGRALAIRPRLLIADEPTGNLDEATGDEVMGLALDLIARTGCGFLMVTHSTRLARRLDRQVTLASGVLAGA